MEMALVNTIAPGEKLLIISHGYFGDRFIKLGQAFGIKIDLLQAEWGKQVDLNHVKEHLEKNQYKAVTVTHADTSTGVQASLGELIPLIKQHGALAIVDGVCATTAMPEDMQHNYAGRDTGDYLLEAAQSLISLMTNIGRWVQELLRMASKEVGLLRVSDAYVQISSIMPQKRNPVSLEHSRSLASSALAEGLAVLHMIHNTPYGDINDTEDDLQPHLYKGFEKADRVLKLLNAVMITMEFDKKRAHQQARENMITITELADVLARDYDVSFRKAHRKAALVANNATALKKELYELPVDTVNEWLKDVTLSEEDWQGIVDPAIFIQRRSITGGPNPDTVREMIADRQRRSG